jgi:L-asparaginase II
MPLARLAHLYARLAQGGSDARLGSAFGDLFDAMTGRPDLVPGEARTGIAVKVTDGAVRALHPATWSVLEQLGLLDAKRRDQLEPYRATLIRNARGTVAGEVRAVFTLGRAHPPV